MEESTDNKPLTWDEYKDRKKRFHNIPRYTESDIVRLDLETAPEEIRGLLKIKQEDYKRGRKRLF